VVDKDRSGKIDANELFEALRYSQYQYYAYETVNMLMTLFDVDGSRTIDIYEFQQLWNYLGEWQMLFETFDMDRTGSINVHELKQALYAFGYRLSDPLLECLVAKFSVRGIIYVELIHDRLECTQFRPICQDMCSDQETF
jgi:Ca2+-binding EF-hand superfamily protein